MATGNGEVPAEIIITKGALDALVRTRGWVFFLGVMGIIGAVLFGLMLLGGIVMLAGHGLAGMIYIVEGAILLLLAIVFSVFWLGYSGALKKLSIAGENLDELVLEALVRQRRLWVLQGVLVLILVGLGILAAIFVPIVVSSYQKLFMPR